MIVKFDYYNPILEKYQSIEGNFLKEWIADDPRFIIENYTVNGVGV